MSGRFFVTIQAPDEKALHRLYEYDLDLFTTRSTPEGTTAVDGLVTLDDVGRLVEDGYQVLVGQTDTPKTTPPVVSFGEWVGETIADLQAQRRRPEE